MMARIMPSLMSQHLVDECPLYFFFNDAVIKIIVVCEVLDLFHVAEVLPYIPPKGLCLPSHTLLGFGCSTHRKRTNNCVSLQITVCVVLNTAKH